jgi:hypothetical protein
MSIENKSKRSMLEDEYRGIEEKLSRVDLVEGRKIEARMKAIAKELENIPFDAVIEDKGSINLETVIEYKTVDNQLNFSLKQNSRKQWYSTEDRVGLTTTIETDANNIPTKILRTFQDSETFKMLGNKVLTKTYTVNFVAKPILPEPKPYIPSGMGFNKNAPQNAKVVKFSSPEELAKDARPLTKQDAKQRKIVLFNRFKK